MNDLPRHTLARIIAEHGREICATPKRIEALLRDLCGVQRREINIIIGALEERVAADLLAAGHSGPRDVLLARLAARLRDNLAYTPEAARWGVETWAVALGVLSEAEFQARARAESAEASRSTAPPPVRDPQPLPANSARVRPPTLPPQRGATYAPPPQPAPTQGPRPSPPIARAPAPVPRPTLTTPAPVVVSPPPHVLPARPARPTSRLGRTLRGCVIFVVLLVLLIVAAIFVVRAGIVLLQQEQAQPGINEPRSR